MGRYRLLGKTIIFQESNEHFFDMQYRAWQAIDAAVNEFDLWYDSCGDILTVLKGYDDKVTEWIVRHANRPLFNELAQLGIYDVSESNYDDECLIFDKSIDALDLVAEHYNDIVAQQQAEEEYRAERKANRGRVVGGGFGIDGALQGMVAAGAMNAVAGAGHGIVNAIGNASSAIAASSSKRALYNNAATKTTLRDGLRSDILACFNAHICLINDRKGDYYVSAFNTDKAGALFENAKKVPAKRIELLIESFKNCPWDRDLLAYIFSAYIEDRKSVWDIAKRFHVDLRDTAEEAFSNMYSAEAKASEDKAQVVKQDILAQMQLLGIESSNTLNRIEQDGVQRILSNYDTADDDERNNMFAQIENYNATDDNKATVIHNLGIWELAEKYSVKFSENEVEAMLTKVYTEPARNQEAEALIAKQKMLAIMKALAVENSTAFDTLEKDCIQRLCQGYQKADEVACNEMIKAINAYDALEKNKKPFLHGLQVRIEAIWSAEDGEIFDNVYLNTNIHSADEVNKAIDFINNKKRTGNSQQYISALMGCNEKNIKKARTYQKPIGKMALWAGLALILLGIIFLIAKLGVVLGIIFLLVGIVPLVCYFSIKKAWDLLTMKGTLVHAMISLSGTVQRNTKEKSDEEVAADIEKEVKMRMAAEEAKQKDK